MNYIHKIYELCFENKKIWRGCISCVFASHLYLRFVYACVPNVKSWYISNWNTIQCASDSTIWILFDVNDASYKIISYVNQHANCMFIFHFVSKKNYITQILCSQPIHSGGSLLFGVGEISGNTQNMNVFMKKVKVNESKQEPSKEVWEAPAIIMNNIPKWVK